MNLDKVADYLGLRGAINNNSAKEFHFVFEECLLALRGQASENSELPLYLS